jgi:hypothetical protein
LRKPIKLSEIAAFVSLFPELGDNELLVEIVLSMDETYREYLNEQEQEQELTR